MVVGENIALRVDDETGASRRTLAVFWDDVVERGEEIPEWIAKSVGTKRADARSNMDADDGWLNLFDCVNDGRSPRL